MIPYITLTIPTYGLMAVIGLIAVLIYLYYRLMICENEYDLSMSEFGILCLSSGLGCFIGSRIVFINTQLPILFKEFSFQKLVQILLFGGFVFYGGLFGAYAGVTIFSRVKKYRCVDMLNTITPAFVLFHVFGRIGCLLGGCCYGLKLNPELVIGNIHFRYFPIQAVEAVVELLLFILIQTTSMKKHKFLSYISCYAVYRFGIEFLRGDTERGIWFGLSTSQWISIIVILAVIINVYLSVTKMKKSTRQTLPRP